jgi:N-sulfoglucosamine sulfohydrolase
MIKMPTPNILYLHSHDTGRYIQPYGYGVPAPNLQKLAEKGVLFRQAFCASPTCSPSRAALLTGCMPHNNGMLGLAHFGFRLADPTRHILFTLREAGYHSVLAGEQHLAKDPAEIGFDQILSGPEPDEERAARFLTQPQARPFFLDIGFNETHREYPEPDTPAAAHYVRPPAPMPDTPAARRDMAGFVKSARILDQKMGRVLSALEESGQMENTMVICTTDHGLPFPGMKCNLTDHGTGVMLILRGPGGVRGGGVVDTPVSHLDIFPTVCDLLGIRPPGWLQGHSLLPLANGKPKHLIFSEINFHVAYDPQRAVRTRRWKYIRRFDGRSNPILPNCDDSPSKEEWLRHGWRNRDWLSGEQLFDLVFDPNEANNLAARPVCSAVLDEMRSHLRSWMEATSDPLLRGPLEWPQGFPRLDPDQTSPSEIRW